MTSSPGPVGPSRAERPPWLEPRMRSGAGQARGRRAPPRPLPSCQASGRGRCLVPPARPACSPGPAEPACFTFCFRARFLPRDPSSLAFRLHIFLHRALPPQVPSLRGRVINMQRMAPLRGPGLRPLISPLALSLPSIFYSLFPSVLPTSAFSPSSFIFLYFCPMLPSPSVFIFSPLSFPFSP